MTVYTLDPLEDARWDEFSDFHPHSSVFHSKGWLRALKQAYGYKPIVFTTCPSSSELTNGVVFCAVNSWLTGRRMVSLPFSDHCEPLIESEEQFQEILSSLKAVQSKDRFKYIEIRPLSEGLLQTSSIPQSESYCFHALDLRPDLSLLFRKLHTDSIQRKIRRADREGLEYTSGNSQVLLMKFYELMLMTRRRHGLPPQPIEWFRNLAECMGNRMTIRVASRSGRPLASILTLSHKETLVYKYGCSDASFHQLGGMPFLFWKAIQEAKEHGLGRLDLGRTDMENQGLMRFKNQWGASRSNLSYFRISSRRRHPIIKRHPIQITKSVFAHLPDPLFVAAGRMLYRHIA